MWIDIVILAVIAVCVFIGARRGLVLSLISALSIVIAIVAAYFLMGPVDTILKSTSLPDKISSSVSDVLEKGADTVGDKASVTAKEILAESHLPDFIVSKLSKIKVGSSISASLGDMCKAIGEKASEIATKALAFLIVFVLAMIAICIIRFLWKGVRQITLVKKVDTWGGICFGLAEGVLAVTAVMLVICTVCSMGHWQGAAEAINGTVVAKFLYEKNFLGAIIALFVK